MPTVARERRLPVEGPKLLHGTEVEKEEAAYLLSQAERCRTLARATADEKMRETLLGMAREYEERAQKAEPPAD